jgi:hypothetical protein
MRDLLLRAKHLFVAAMLAVPLCWNRLHGAASAIMQRKSNDATVNPPASSKDEQAIAEHQVEPAGTDNTVSWLAFLGERSQTTGRLQ